VSSARAWASSMRKRAEGTVSARRRSTIQQGKPSRGPATFPAALIKVVEHAPDEVMVVVQKRPKGQSSYQDVVSPLKFGPARVEQAGAEPSTSWAEMLDGPLTELFRAVAAPRLR
jgi:hypothetical protein